MAIRKAYSIAVSLYASYLPDAPPCPASILQYFTTSEVVIIYAAVVLGGLCIGGGILIYPTVSNLITSRSYELTNNDEQEIELGINDDEI